MFLFTVHHRSSSPVHPMGFVPVYHRYLNESHLPPACMLRQSEGVDFQHSWVFQLGSPQRRLASCLSFPCSIPSHMTPLFCPPQALVFFWLHKLVQRANPFWGGGNKHSHCLRPFQQADALHLLREIVKGPLGVCNLRERSFVLKEPCVQSALSLLEGRQQSSGGVKDKRQRRPSKAQHSSGAAAGELQLSTTPKPCAASVPWELKTTLGFCDSDRIFSHPSLYPNYPPLCPWWDTDLPYNLYLHSSWNCFSSGNFMFWSFCLG